MTLTGAARALTPRRSRPMTTWRLEWLRLTRSRRWIALVAVYLVFGLIGPVMAEYMAGLLEHVQSGITIIVPPPQPKDGIVNYLSQVGQIGLIVVVAIAAGAMSFDARRGISTFLRTRAHGMWALVTPRFTVNAVAAVLAYAIGLAAAWYETVLLLGPLPVGAMLAGLLCESVYLIFAVAVVTAAASFARGTLGTVGIALGVLILLSIVGSLEAVHDWLPSTLSGAPVDLLTTNRLSDYTPSLLVAVAASALLVWVAVVRLLRREV
jgi:ABC-2 type transport system permease protein